MTTKQYLIWDLPLRLFHWLFAMAIVGAWYTSDQDNDLIEYHMLLGYFILGLVIFRVVWGFIGTKHARFSSFIPSFSRLINYIKHFNDSELKPSVGHNPLGSLMVVVMIALVLLQAISGLFMNDEIFSSGPYYGSVSDEVDKVMSILHHNIFDYLIAAIVAHLLAIAFYYKVKKNNLVSPMITGKKSANQVSKADSISHSKLVLAIVLAIFVGAFIYWLVVINAPVLEEYYY